MLFYRSPAKINLTLDILSRRADGYHELQSVTHCIGLFDTLGLDLTGAPGLSFRCSDAALNSDENLCLKAARLWLQATQTLEGKRRYFPGIRLTLDKKIPIGAGLGGGSSNAAATLVALNTHFDAPLNSAQLYELAAKLGADVPLFLQGGCALLEGIGEKISALPALSGHAVLVHPSQHADTPGVYRRFDEIGEFSPPSTPDLIQAVRAGNLQKVAANLENDLRKAAQSLGIDTAIPIRLLKKHGALGAQMSGSGAASFGLFESEGAARRAQENLRADAELPPKYQIFCAPLLASGISAFAND
jgi:4-diphosphocytidyl-2-C-methyl-D-erythritol kinase